MVAGNDEGIGVGRDYCIGSRAGWAMMAFALQEDDSKEGENYEVWEVGEFHG
jgi:hypothetical protein